MIYKLIKLGKTGEEDVGVRFERPVSMEEVHELVNLEPGSYKLVTEKGEDVWGKIMNVVPPKEEKEEVKERKGKMVLTADDLMAIMVALKDLKEKGAESFRFLKAFFEGPSLEDALEVVEKWKDKLERVQKVFGGGAVAGRPEEIPVEGKLKAWTVYGPKLVREFVKGAREEIREALEDFGLRAGVREEVEKMPELPEVKKGGK